jgi:hypothetical protein
LLNMASRRKRSRDASVLAFLGGILLALLLFDSGLRLVEVTPLWRILPVIEPIPGQPDRDFGFDATPGAQGIWSKEHRARIRVNSLGLRDVERALVKPPGTLRVGLLGDSMVEAMQVSQEATFGALAEHGLRAEGYQVELINLAIAGPSPLRQLLRLEKRGYALNLDLVLANSASSSFWSGALRDDSQNPGYIEAGDGRLVRGYAFRQRFSQRHADDLLGRSFVALYQHSPLFRMLYLRGREPAQLFRLTASQTASPASARIVAPDPAALCRATATALDPHIALWMQHQPALEWAATSQFLDEFSQSTAAHGVTVLYAVRDIPLAPSNCPSVDARRAELILAMEAEFRRRGMTFVDWSSSVAAAVGQRDLEWLHGFGVQRGGGHLNYDGHRAWAVALVDLLKTRLPRLHQDPQPTL